MTTRTVDVKTAIQQDNKSQCEWEREGEGWRQSVRGEKLLRRNVFVSTLRNKVT